MKLILAIKNTKEGSSHFSLSKPLESGADHNTSCHQNPRGLHKLWLYNYCLISLIRTCCLCVLTIYTYIHIVYIGSLAISSAESRMMRSFCFLLGEASNRCFKDLSLSINGGAGDMVPPFDGDGGGDNGDSSPLMLPLPLALDDRVAMDDDETPARRAAGIEGVVFLLTMVLRLFDLVVPISSAGDESLQWFCIDAFTDYIRYLTTHGIDLSLGKKWSFAA